MNGSVGTEGFAENVMREAMHPADEFDAFKKLADEGQGPEAIAARFGASSRMMEQRLKLAVVSPKLIAVYRKDEMTLEQLMAFTVSDKHREQEKVWKELPEWVKNQGQGDPIRDQLTEKHIDAAPSLSASKPIRRQGAAFCATYSTRRAKATSRTRNYSPGWPTKS